MMHLHDLILGFTDAHALAAMLDGHRRGQSAEADAARALVALLTHARRVPDAALPRERIAMGSHVSYAEENGAVRSVTLVYPAQADFARKRISVLSPVGRALIGRRQGEHVDVALPGGRLMEIHIVSVQPAQEPLREAA